MCVCAHEKHEEVALLFSVSGFLYPLTPLTPLTPHTSSIRALCHAEDERCGTIAKWNKLRYEYERKGISKIDATGEKKKFMQKIPQL